MHYSIVNDVRLAYRLVGNAGPTIVLIHGLGGGAEATYAPVIERLHNEFRLLAFDNRGAGGSGAPHDGYTLAQFAGDVRGLMRNVGVESAHIVGHSLGGMIAQQFAVDYPAAALSLVLADCPGTVSDAARANFEQRAATVEAGGTAAIVEGVIANGIGTEAKDRYPELVERFRKSLLATEAKPYAASCRAVTTLNLIDRLAAFAKPVLVLRGDQDGGVPAAAARALAGAFPNGRFEEVPQSGHNTPFENAPAFSDQVASFLRTGAAAGGR